MKKMTPPREPQEVHVEPELASPYGCFVRVLWLVLGSIGVIAAAVTIYRGDHGMLSLPSALLWTFVALASALRYVEIARFDETRPNGERAQASDWRRYSARLFAFALSAWSLALLL